MPGHFKRTRYANAFLTLALAIATQVASAAAPDPQAIAEVRAGKRVVAQASWWGFQPEESTAALQAAIDSGAKKVVVEKMPSPWIVDTLRLAGDQELFFEPGAEVLAKKGAFHGSADSLFSAAGKKNIKLIGPGATLRMRRADYDSPDYKHAEWRHVLNFHGCTVPRGWSRTYPHLLSMEAVRGAENYTFSREYPEKAPWHNAILPFTRNVVGPMDYTPVAFTNGGNAPRTTVGHELALSVVFESGLLHFADRVSAYRELPPEPQQWLKTIPVVWDETRLLGGFPGKWLVVARRQGTDWYLGGINGQDQPQPVALEWRFLADGKYALHLIEDGVRDRSFADRQLTVDRTQPLELRLPPRGGFVGGLIVTPSSFFPTLASNFLPVMPPSRIFLRRPSIDCWPPAPVVPPDLSAGLNVIGGLPSGSTCLEAPGKVAPSTFLPVVGPRMSGWVVDLPTLAAVASSLRATAPAATRPTVSRAEARPPPCQLRMPYLAS